MTNKIIEQQISAMKADIQLFKVNCHLAAKKDDGIISKEEQKQLKAIDKAADRFIKDLSAVK